MQSGLQVNGNITSSGTGSFGYGLIVNGGEPLNNGISVAGNISASGDVLANNLTPRS